MSIEDVARLTTAPGVDDLRYTFPLLQEFGKLPLVIEVMQLVAQCRIELQPFAGFVQRFTVLANLKDDKGNAINITFVFAEEEALRQQLPDIVIKLPTTLSIGNFVDLDVVKDIAYAANGCVTAFAVNVQGCFRDIRRLPSVNDLPQVCLARSNCVVPQAVSHQVNSLVVRFDGNGRAVIFYGGHQVVEKSPTGWKIRDTSRLESHVRSLCGSKSLDTSCLLKVCSAALESIDTGRGATFVFGDAETVVGFCQLMNPNLREVIPNTDLSSSDPTDLSAYAVPDGAVIIGNDGRVQCLGMRLCPPAADVQIQLRSHRGTRHRSVAETTAASRAIGVVVAGTDGMLTIFADGQALFEW